MKKTPSKKLDKPTTPPGPTPLEKALLEADAVIADLAGQLGIPPGLPMRTLNEAAKRMNDLQLALKRREDET